MGAMGTTMLMTLEEFEALPDGPEQIELLAGELIRMPPPEREHMEIVERLYELLKAEVEALRRRVPSAELGKVHMEMGYLLSSTPRSWLRPDVSLTYPGQPGKQYYEGSPVMAFEVVSADDRAPELNRKVFQYLACGSREVWLIYPDARSAYVHRPGEPAVIRHDQAIVSSLLPDITLRFEQFLDTGSAR